MKAGRTRNQRAQRRDLHVATSGGHSGVNIARVDTHPEMARSVYALSLSPQITETIKGCCRPTSISEPVS